MRIVQPPILITLAALLSGCLGGAETVDLDTAIVPAVIKISVSGGNSVNEGLLNGSIEFEVALSGASTTDIEIEYETVSGSAFDSLDYVGSSATLTIPAGILGGTIAVSVVDDSIDEPDESFDLNLTAASDGEIETGSANGTIIDDDNPPTISISSVSLVEGDSGQANASFAVALDSVSGFDVSANFSTSDLTAAAGQDYSASSGIFTIPAGETSTEIIVVVNGDVVDEGDETFSVTLTNPVNASLGTASATGTIADDDAGGPVPVIVSIGDATSVSESASGSTLDFPVMLSDVSALDIDVEYQTVDGTASAGSDYSAQFSSLRIPAGATSGTIVIGVADDAMDEPDESMSVQITLVTSGSIGASTGAGTILDDDSPPSLSIGDVSVTEGDTGTTDLTFDVSISAPSAFTISANYATSDGSAAAGEDFIASSGQLVIPPGGSVERVTISVSGDTVVEPDETLTLSLSAALNVTILDGAGIGTILNDDSPPEISVGDAQLTEGDAGQATMSFTVSLSNTSSQDVSFDFATADGTATDPADYLATSGNRTIAAGSTTTTIAVDIVGDTEDEGDEDFTVVVSNPSGATISDGTGIGTIVDDDAPPAISVSDAQLDEGDSGQATMSFTVSLNNASSQDVSFDFATADGTATDPADYLAASGNRTITAGSTTTTVTVDVVGDTEDEGDEEFTVNISNPTGAAIADGTGIGTIVDDDSPLVMSVSDAQVDEGNSGQATMSFTVSLDNASSQDVSFDFATADGTATDPADYLAASGNRTITAGSTSTNVTVNVVGDTEVEGDEDFALTVSNPSGAVISDGVGLGTIIDDDTLVVISVGDTQVAEGDSGQSTMSFTVSLDNASSQDVSFDFATADGTATDPADYLASSGNRTITAGSTSTNVTVNVVGDTEDEGDEDFTLTVSSPSGATISDGTGVGTIVNDDSNLVSGLDTRPSNSSCIAPDRPILNTSLTTQDAFPNLPTLVNPVGLIMAPGDTSQWYVIERDGRVQRFSNNGSVSSLSTFIDIRSPGDPIDVDSGSQEAGLLGMAFHPDYGNGNWYVYLSYMIDAAGSGGPFVSIVSRFESKDSGLTLDATDATEVLRLTQPYSNHNGGQIGFGPDGYLYISFGDGGSGGDPGDRAQNTRNLFGNMLRIDVDNGSPYGIPADNPFAGNSRCSSGSGSASCPETYAWGLRNPWKWSFDNPTGQLWLGDVGQGSWEEIDLIELGGNYGWRCREGAHNFNTSGNCPAGLIDPVIEYSHSVGNSITGGAVYHGDNIPQLTGRYVFADYSRGKIFASVDNGDGTFGYDQLLDTSFFISAFAIEPNDELLFLNYGSGDIRRIVQSGGSSNDQVATTLSASGCVSASNPSQPASGVIPYDINVLFWSDGAAKERYYAIPDGTSIDVNADGDWVFPVGSVLMKHFRINNQLIETRLFMRHADGVWAGYSYEWNSAGTDADRLFGAKSKTISGQEWIYPSGPECMQCHTQAAGFSLGPEHGQLNKDFTYPSTGRTANQLFTADDVDLLTDPLTDIPNNLPRFADPADTSETLDDRARSYLHSNCAGCHRPGGPTPSNMDLRHATTLPNTNTCNVVPVSGNLGIANARIVSPGNASASVLVERVSRRDSHGMPPLGSTVVDAAGVQLLANWVNSLGNCQ